MKIERDVAHGGTHYARREYGYRNGQVSYLATSDGWLGWGTNPRAAVNDLLHDQGRRR